MQHIQHSLHAFTFQHILQRSRNSEQATSRQILLQILDTSSKDLNLYHSIISPCHRQLSLFSFKLFATQHNAPMECVAPVIGLVALQQWDIVPQ
jgi:hypothetical protein